MNEQFVPTARNSERWQRPDHGAANKYIPGALLVQQEQDKQAVVRHALALRHAYRLERRCDVSLFGTPFERGCHRILDQLLALREARDFFALIDCDRMASGMIESARAFEDITLTQFDSLAKLRLNALEYRQKELQP